MAAGSRLPDCGPAGIFIRYGAHDGARGRTLFRRCVHNPAARLVNQSRNSGCPSGQSGRKGTGRAFHGRGTPLHSVTELLIHTGFARPEGGVPPHNVTVICITYRFVNP